MEKTINCDISVFNEEEKDLADFIKFIDSRIADEEKNIENAQKSLKSESYDEDQKSFEVSHDKGKINKANKKIELYRELRDSPYYAHLECEINGEKQIFYLKKSGGNFDEYERNGEFVTIFDYSESLDNNELPIKKEIINAYYSGIYNAFKINICGESKEYTFNISRSVDIKNSILKNVFVKFPSNFGTENKIPYD